MAAIQLRRYKILLSAQNNHLKKEAAKAFNDIKEALNEVSEKSKSWALKAFEMPNFPEEVPRFERRLLF